MDVNVSITNASPHEIYDLAFLFAKELVVAKLAEAKNTVEEMIA